MEDITSPPILKTLLQVGKPLYYVFGNHDGDMAGVLERELVSPLIHCMGWRGEILHIGGKAIGMAHGHLSLDIRPILKEKPNYLFSGHFHERKDWMEGPTRRINPGALHRTKEPGFALFDTSSERLNFIDVN